MIKTTSVILGVSLAWVASAADAMPIAPLADAPSATIQVSGGCGPYAWRGPWGHCRDTPYYGRMPNGSWKLPRYAGNGCPPGYWRGPWGHCRNTPYHGRLPGGGWK